MLNPRALLEPIPGDHICGEDISYSTEFDEIREARRQDDATLAQGEWQTQLKNANWPRVRDITESLLLNRSKDLQALAWHTEAMTRLHGFPGLTLGLQVFEGFLDDFWEFFYPVLDTEDMEERASKFDWLNRQLSQVVRETPLTEARTGGYSWLKWEESRALENLGLKDPAAKEKALQEGKLSGEQFDKAVRTSGRDYYETFYRELRRALTAVQSLQQKLDERFGESSPSLKELQGTIQKCSELAFRQLSALGGVATEGDMEEGGLEVESPDSSPAGNISKECTSRADAVNRLRTVARYFRQHEPHSPVALLVERAANWAEMPLEKWLGSVIKDEAILRQLRELLDIRD